MLKIDVDSLITEMAGADPTKLLRLHLVKQQLASIDHTPVHPVYPFMIREAIIDLDEEGGSTVDAISDFILRKYDVLGFVLPAKLVEQLQKLVEEKQIVLNIENRYVLPAIVEETEKKTDEPTEIQRQGLNANSDQVEAQSKSKVTKFTASDDLAEVHMVSEEEEGMDLEHQDVATVDETDRIEQPKQLQQTLEMIQDQVEVQHQNKVAEDTRPNFQHSQGEVEVPETLPAKGHPQLEKGQIEETEIRGHEAEVTEAQMPPQELQNTVKNRTRELRSMSKLCTKNREEAVAMTTIPFSPNRSQTFSTLLKEKYVRLWEMIKAFEQELASFINDLEAVEVSNQNVSHPVNGEVLTVPPESKEEIVPCSVCVPTDGMQHLQNQQMEQPALKRTPEPGIMSLEESFQTQNKKAKLCNEEGEDQYQHKVDLEPLGMERQQRFSTFEGHLERCGSQNQSKPLLVAGSSDATEEFRKLELKQQPEHQLGLPKSKTAFELSMMKKDGAVSEGAEHIDHGDQLNTEVLENAFKPTVQQDQLQVMEIQQVEQKMEENEMNVVEEPEFNVGMANHSLQLKNIERVEELKISMVPDESFQLKKQRGKGRRSLGKQAQGEQPQRQLRPRGPRPSATNPAHATVPSNVYMAYSSLKRKQKEDPLLGERPQEKRPKEASDEVQSVEKLVGLKPVTEGNCVQTPQQSQLRCQNNVPSNTGQTVDKPMAEELFLQHYIGQQDHPKRRGRPPKLKSSLDTTKGESLSLEGQNHHKEKPTENRCTGRSPKVKACVKLTGGQPASDCGGQNHHSEQSSQIQSHGARPTNKTSAKHAMTKAPLDNQDHDEQQSEKCSQGKPSKLMFAAGESVESLPPQNLPKKLPKSQHQGSRPKSSSASTGTMITLLSSPHGQKQPSVASVGRVTRARAAVASSLPSTMPAAAAAATCLRQAKPPQ